MLMRAPVRSLSLLAVAVTGIACGGHNPPAFDTPPALANREEITEAMRSVGAGVEARIVLLVRVDEEGHVRDVRVTKSSGSDELDDAARWIGERMRFEPARHEGRAIAATVQVPVTFDVVVSTYRKPRLRNLSDVLARMAGEYGDLSGQVRLQVYVGADGWVQEIREGRSSDPGLVTPARKLAEMMKFQPAYRGGALLASWVNLTFEFAGDESELTVEASEALTRQTG